MSRKWRLSKQQKLGYSQLRDGALLQATQALLVYRTKRKMLGQEDVKHKYFKLKFCLELCALRGLDPHQRTEETKKCVQHK